MYLGSGVAVGPVAADDDAADDAGADDAADDEAGADDATDEDEDALGTAVGIGAVVGTGVAVGEAHAVNTNATITRTKNNIRFILLLLLERIIIEISDRFQGLIICLLESPPCNFLSLWRHHQFAHHLTTFQISMRVGSLRERKDLVDSYFQFA